MTMLQRHIASPSLVNKAAYAIANLSANAINLDHLSSVGAVDAIANCTVMFVDKSIAKVGIFRAIAALTNTSSENRARFTAVPKATSSFIKALYEDIEYEEITLWGCRAIVALTKDNRLNVSTLGSVGNYMDEILRQYKGNLDITKIALQAISALAHGNTSNRSLLGVSGACDEVGEALPLLSYEDEHTAQLACRVIANLAANHPNNQHKLGVSGACEYLIGVLTDHCLGEVSDPAVARKTTRLACWAVANLVETSKGRNTSGTPTEEKKRSSLNIAGLLDGMVEAKSKKNSQKFDDLNIVTALESALTQYGSDTETALWIVRAINNLSKTKSIRDKFIRIEMLQALDKLLTSAPTAGEGVPSSSGLVEWVTITKETLLDQPGGSRKTLVV